MVRNAVLGALEGQLLTKEHSRSPKMLYSPVGAFSLGDGSFPVQTKSNHFEGERNATALLQGIKELQTASAILRNPL